MLNYTEKTPKYLYPKLNGFGDNGQWSLKIWQLLHTYWLPNTYWNWQEYVVSVMLIAVHNIKVTCEWHTAIKQNYKNNRTRVIVVYWLPTTIHSNLTKVARLLLAITWECNCSRRGPPLRYTEYDVTDRVQYALFSGLYLRNHWTLDIGVLGFFGIV